MRTLEAFLPSAGLNERSATLHKYSHSEPIVIPDGHGGRVRGVGHFYRCTETGETRRWGFDAETVN